MSIAEAPSGHAALMDSVYRRQRHFYDATRKFYLLGRDHLIDGLDVPAGGTVLEIGCGTGRNMFRAMNQYPNAIYHGLDISEEMLATARRALLRASPRCRALLATGDAMDFDARHLFGRNKFDRVYISYALSMIPQWRHALALASECLADGGSLHVVDFGQQERLPRWFHSALCAWLANFHVEPRGDLAEALSHEATRIGGQTDFIPLYRGYAWHAVLKRPYSSAATTA